MAKCFGSYDKSLLLNHILSHLHVAQNFAEIDGKRKHDCPFPNCTDVEYSEASVVVWVNHMVGDHGYDLLVCSGEDDTTGDPLALDPATDLRDKYAIMYLPYAKTITDKWTKRANDDVHGLRAQDKNARAGRKLYRAKRIVESDEEEESNEESNKE
ncbi:hypothetical protein ONZ45_g5810 [Pleurotus djamor]|nr:hypothetical protein ONZ45_g5810 [Pleurotus djamor]